MAAKAENQEAEHEDLKSDSVSDEAPASTPSQRIPENREPESEAAPHPAESAAVTMVEENPGEDESGVGDEEDDFLMIRPSLGFVKGISSSNGSDTGKKTQQKKETKQNSEPQQMTCLEDVEKCWKSYLNVVKESAPQMLYFQILRFKLKDLKGSTLTVSVDNEFAINLVEENQQLLSSLFKRMTGCFIRFSCVVEHSEESKKDTVSPYERFKEIQKQDPHLRKIVELFGAELEY